MAGPTNIRETDLYAPVKQYLEENGYEVKAEVVNCDITATRGEELIVIELKRSANVQLLIQATDRQRITDSVYAAIPAARHTGSHWRGVQRLMRMLELGLLVVDFELTPPRVTRLFDPLPYARRKRGERRRAVIREIAERTGDYNVAGSSGRKLTTAYRENAVFVACCLQRMGPASPRQLRAWGTGPKTLGILSNNYYGWFQRVDRGIYELTDAGAKELADYSRLVSQFRTLLPDPDPGPLET